MVSWFSGNQFPVDGKTALITGGSQGFGLTIARQLSAKGANVVIAARNKEKLSQAIQEIAAQAKSPSSQRFHTVSAELTSEEENARLIADVTAWNHGSAPDIVWANAGAATPMFFLDADIAQLRKQFELNYWTACYLARESITAWLGKTSKEKQDPKHFIMTASTASIIGVPGYSTYAPAKAAMRSLHDVLRMEMDYYNASHKEHRQKGLPTPPHVKMHTILPGTILTPGYDEEMKIKPAVLKKIEESDAPQNAEECARNAIKGLEAGRGLVPTQGIFGDGILTLGLGGSYRDRPVRDVTYAWLTHVVWLVVGWDIKRTLINFAEKAGVPKHASVKTDA